MYLHFSYYLAIMFIIYRVYKDAAKEFVDAIAGNMRPDKSLHS